MGDQGHPKFGLWSESLHNLDRHFHPSAFPIEMRIGGRTDPNGSADQISQKQNDELTAIFSRPRQDLNLRPAV